MKNIRLIAIGVSSTAIMSLATGPLVVQALAAEGGSSTARVSVRVEGLSKTLLASTVVNTKAAALDPDGKPADTCEGDTAAVALQDATKGRWTAGAYYSGLGYSVQGLFGESYSFSSSYYWSFWVDGKVASAGICGITLRAKDQLLFFPQCSKESAAACPDGTFNPAVLELTGPRRAHTGKAVAVKVRALDNLTGKPSPGANVKLSYRGGHATTGTGGVAHLRFSKPGSYHITATAPNSIRDELTITVH